MLHRNDNIRSWFPAAVMFKEEGGRYVRGSIMHSQCFSDVANLIDVLVVGLFFCFFFGGGEVLIFFLIQTKEIGY